LLFNPGPAMEAASLIIKKTVSFWPSFIQEVQGLCVQGVWVVGCIRHVVCCRLWVGAERRRKAKS
jgi:hypothetical protein